jgi:G3E family GTPase
MRFSITLSLVLLFGFGANAEPLKFKTWKEQQIVEAQNEVLRLSAKLRQIKSNAKSDKIAKEQRDPNELVTSHRFEKNPDVNDKDLKRAQENLEIAKDFSIEDYAEIYVSSLQQDPDQFSRLVETLSKDEMAQLMKVLVKNKIPETNDAKHQKTSIRPSLAASAIRS